MSIEIRTKFIQYVFSLTILLFSHNDCNASNGDQFSFSNTDGTAKLPSSDMVFVFIKDKYHPVGGSLIIKNRLGNKLMMYDVDRAIGGKWSPNGKLFYINDYNASNFSDCILPYRMSVGWTLQSLEQILRVGPGSGPVDDESAKPPESIDNSHYYLNCVGWHGNGDVKVDIHGTTDAGGKFEYKLIYNVADRKFTNE